MTILNTRVRTAVRYAHAAAELLPAPPTGEPGALAREWELLVMETAVNIAAAVHQDEDALRLAIGPAIEVGTNPPWRVLLELALRASGGTPQCVTAAELRAARFGVSA